MYPSIAGHSAYYENNVMDILKIFIMHCILCLLCIKYNLSNIVVAWVNSVLFVMLSLERVLYLNIPFSKLSRIIVWFILCYIINYTLPQSYIIIYICFTLYFINLELKLLLDSN